MFDVQTEELMWGGRKLVLETGKIARQADAAVLATYGETVVLATVVSAKSPKPGIDFFPLTVNYQEKTFAAGRIPGGYFKREGRPTEKETLVSRLIDRPIRPLFVEGYRNETQVVCTVLQHDLENDPDIVAMVAASAALTLSGVPFTGPVGAARVGYFDGAYKLNPLVDEIKESQLDLVVAGTPDAVLMVESEAKQLSEEIMLGAVMFGHKHFQPVIDAIIRLAEKAAKEPRDYTPADNSAVLDAVLKLVDADIRAAYQIRTKAERYKALDAAKAKVASLISETPDGVTTFTKEQVGSQFKEAQAKVVRWMILDDSIRIDGRDLKTVRKIVVEAGILPRTHGSALFTRGETQALVVTTLGTGDDEQFIDSLEGTYKETFLLHYNFPPYSVGEAGRMGSPGRREIGHGKLAWRAIRPMLPAKSEFPYTIRVVSEITESNGSSSMATVCGTSLALMDAGVPLKAPVAGIAMGLILEGKRFAVLSDILGDEDHLGDMDFKVAGTADGITSLQMDIKIAGITEEIMKVALDQAKGGRDHILNEMNKALATARGQLGEYAPRIETMKIPVDKIREVIGSGGKVIREIVEKTGAKVNIEDDGTIKIASADGKSIEAAIKWIKSIVSEAEPGMIYDGTVVKIMEFGAFVNFFGAKDGLVHISELAAARVQKVSDVVKEGDKVKVKFLGQDERGKIRLSMKVVDQETGEDITEKLKAQRDAEKTREKQSAE
ncbi:MAG: polyribonucleotide nucleotidyltransferase [Bosea sp. (in: a-proteobacteria)]|jgi:polyribonucleotide nucleotidyltransferase|uniref:polyribonucleotide nucleotidyltransferase n=1 Tax=unclassified Bosea (in: a-proteobacteria) TaxID=2653178 RepID=UPI00083E3704|nr:MULTISPECIES: polyribonucleotide nucleotidyltransferase [unclassified Bosea (in: a-proteobacteria)]MBA4335235.1 polyribonucleotide nucleotidyltransferase [Methylobacterium sp.]MCZ8045017.1 polyribonucleotide nucleotidyltransferase [Beijerinckiaceae bacterium]AOG03926.1 polyribonucleotide nucleotidyltransferase [Bosea sp. RAC05]MDP3603798.1 polyribonucleotide nucleotidyltransferase [Bosea sp. (in: a-proteobacteria)]WRH56887.1 MAG: polyribonucleotide nucleotidyltransferase [Bosea sp. (in: a-p